MSDSKNNPFTCPHCGEKIEQEPHVPKKKELGSGCCDFCREFTHEGRYVNKKWTCLKCTPLK